MNAALHHCLCTAVFLLLIAPVVSLAQTPNPMGNAGTDFWLSFPANWNAPGSSNTYVRLYITAETRTRVAVTAGPTVLADEFTVANDIMRIDVPLNLAEVVSRTDRAAVPDDAVYTNRAVHIQSDDPIVVYAINSVTYTADGLLALPVGALGREYIVTSAPDITGSQLQKLPSQYVIVAPHNNTNVTVVNSWDTPNNAAGDTVTFSMNQGDVYSAMSDGGLGDLSGSHIVADKPVAVIAGQNCTYLPDFRYPACDHLVEQLLPLDTWGHTYHLVPFATRRKGDLIRVYAGAPDAEILVNGTALATLPRVGGGKDEGWLELLPEERELLTIRSNRPIQVAQYNNSGAYDGVQSDPFMLVLTPVEQYQTDVTFATPGADYPDNYINLVTDSANYYQIEIAPAGTDAWKTVAEIYGDTVEAFSEPYNDTAYVGASFTIEPGVYRMRAPRGFAGYIYGFSEYETYGYPLSVGVKRINLSVESASTAEDGTALRSIFPNPATGTTATVRYELAAAGSATLELYAGDGRLVRRWFDGAMHAAGAHERVVSIEGLSAGRYFCRLRVGNRSVVLPMVVR